MHGVAGESASAGVQREAGQRRARVGFFVNRPSRDRCFSPLTFDRQDKCSILPKSICMYATGWLETDPAPCRLEIPPALNLPHASEQDERDLVVPVYVGLLDGLRVIVA